MAFLFGSFTFCLFILYPAHVSQPVVFLSSKEMTLLWLTSQITQRWREGVIGVISASFVLSISISLNMIFLCVLTGHAIFKVTYLSNHDYKPLYFESDAATVNEIVLKVSSDWMSVSCPVSLS